MKRLAILQQFDPAGGVPPHVRLHLAGLRPVATRIVLVSNSPVSSKDREETAPLVDALIERGNVGWDFGGWRDAIAAEDMGEWDEVLLTNSSVVGPLYPLEPIFAEMAKRRETEHFDFWGLVLSRQIRTHLQSYFFVFDAAVTRSDAWRDFWRGVADIEDKDAVIDRYEAGLTAALSRVGFRHAAFMPDPSLLRRIRMVEIERLGIGLSIPFDATRVNRTVRWHDELILAGFPYLKASLLWGKDVHRLRHFEAIRELTGAHYDWSALGLDLTGRG